MKGFKDCPECGSKNSDDARQCNFCEFNFVPPPRLSMVPKPVFTPAPQFPPDPPAPQPKPSQWQIARGRQPQSVLDDPRYNVNTGAGVACTSCGSTNVQPISKPGLGFGIFGSIQTVLIFSAIDGLTQSVQRQPYACTYCNAKFYPG